MKDNQLYSGKVKSLYKASEPGFLIMHHSDNATAFNAKKKAVLPGKGKLNNLINAKIMQVLQSNGIATHFEKILNSTDSLVKSLDMFPVECIVRNYTAGSLCKRLGLVSGVKLDQPIFEFCYKSDELGDPLINDSHIISLGYATTSEIDQLKDITLRVNSILCSWFASVDLKLVDFKLEFGKKDGQIFLADEITPDGARILNATTQEILDKDRFRQDLGYVLEKYRYIAEQLDVNLNIPLSSIVC